MSEYYNTLKTALADIRKKTDFTPKTAIVLGSGLGALADEIDTVAEISYREITGFPVSTVEGHKGRLVFGYIGKAPVVIMQGRVHLYEGYTPQQVVMPTRLVSMLGAEVLLLTNAAGGISDSLSAGDLMVLDDHISCFVPSPLIGENIKELGTRFPDMSSVYDKALRDCIFNVGKNIGAGLKGGVYCQLTGPQYETPTEVRMLERLGADAVGMSTAIEAIAAVHCGMRVCGVSCITNMAAGKSKTALSHSEVQETADKTADVFKTLVREFVQAVG
jgi:purine-nucleoside phosphorylase